MLKFEMFERKSDALGAYGFNFCLSSVLVVPRFSSPLAFWGISTISVFWFGSESAASWGHIFKVSSTSEGNNKNVKDCKTILIGRSFGRKLNTYIIVVQLFLWEQVCCMIHLDYPSFASGFDMYSLAIQIAVRHATPPTLVSPVITTD